jgi:tetratricopeptide (TPR) repeat protein
MGEDATNTAPAIDDGSVVRPQVGRWFGDPTRLIERGDAVTSLARAVTSLVGGAGGTILIAGAFGMGKTALVDLMASFGAVDRRRLDKSGAAGAPAAYRVDVLAGLGNDPMVVIAEDAHQLTAEQAADLVRIDAETRVRPLLLVATYRPGELVTGDAAHVAIAEIARHATVISLEPLSVDGVLELAEAASASPLAEADAASLHARTGGNPLLVHDLLAHSTSDALPQRSALILRARVARLAEPTRTLLETIAVVGPSSIETLAKVAGLELGDALAATDDATKGGLLVERAGTTQLVIGAVGEVVRDDLASTKRARIHAAAAAVLSADRVTTVASLAAAGQHWLAGQSVIGPDRTGLGVLEVGRRLALKGAHAEALVCFEAAWERGRSTGEADLEAEAHFAAGGSAAALGRDLEASRLLYEALDSASRAHRDDLRVEIVLRLADISIQNSVRDIDAAVPLLEEALAATDPDDVVTRGRLMAAMGESLLSQESSELRRRRAAELAAVASGVQDVDLKAAALLTRHNAMFGEPLAEQRLAIAEELVALKDRAEVGDGLVRVTLINDLLELGRFSDAVNWSYELERRVTDGDDDTALGRAVGLLAGMRALATGPMSAAEAALVDSLDRGNSINNTASQIFVARWLQGRLAEIEGTTRSLAVANPAAAVWATGVVFLLAELGRNDEGKALLRGLCQPGFPQLPPDDVQLCSLVILAWACARLHDGASAQLLYETLSPWDGFWATGGLAASLTVGPISHALGLLLATLGRPDEAVASLRRALADAGSQGATVWKALAQRDLAAALTTRAHADDAAEIASLSAAAAESAARLELEAGPSPIAGDPTAVQAVPTTVSRRATSTASCIAEGHFWRVTFGERTSMVRDSKGMRYLAALLAAPGREFHVLDLIGAPVRGTDEGGGLLLDAAARTAYRERIVDLREDIAQAEDANDIERAAMLNEELEALLDEIKQSVGMSGRSRTFVNASERARQSVTKAVRTAVGHLSSADAALGEHLTASTRTGVFCTYQPDPRARVTWTVDPG